MEEQDVIKIVIAKDDYREIYAPFPEDPREADNKIKRGMLAKSGMTEEEIESILDQVEVEFDSGAEGRFDDGPYTPIRLVKNIKRDEKDIYIPPEEPELEPAKEPRQVMIKQYYGDANAERQRRKTFARFKSHIVQKQIKVYDKDGKSKTMDLYTIEDYDTKTADSNELLLDGYQTRLERLSRAHQRDFSPYERQLNILQVTALKEVMEKYEEMHKVNPLEAEQFKKSAMEQVYTLRDEKFKKKAIQALIDQDTEFIETNNYGYNDIQNTSKNLETLGKLGENAVRAQISVDQKNLQKMGLHTLNAIIEIRNHTTAPINRAIGTFVAAPIYRKLFNVLKPKYKQPVEIDGFLITPMEDMIATSQKNAKGMFKNKPSHRYHARKDYFIEEQKKLIASKHNNEQLKDKDGNEQVKRTSLGEILALAIVPRVKAITNFKEGNVAVLNAGLYDLTMAAEERQSQITLKVSKFNRALRRAFDCEEEVKHLKRLDKVVKNEETKEQINKAIEVMELQQLILEARAAKIKREEIDSIQTDAISMSQHDKANKAMITDIVKGVKTAGRVAIGTYIGKYIYREVAHQAKTPDRYEHIPGKTKTIQEEIVEHGTESVPGLDKEGVGDITLGNIYSKGSEQLYHHITGGNVIQEDKTEFFRGLAFKYDGKLYSGSDGKGFDPTVLTKVRINQEINENTSVVSLVQEILQDSTKQKFTTEQIEQLILDGKIQGFNVWRSTQENGVPSGWLDASQIVSNLIANGSHEVPKEIVKTVSKQVTEQRKTVLIPGTEYTYNTMELNPAVVAAEVGLGALEALEWSDLLRFTRSQESLLRRQPRLLEAMKAENDRKRAAKKENKEKDSIENENDSQETKVKKLRDIASYQRNNKSKFRRYTYSGDRMRTATEVESTRRKGVTTWEKFYGTKKEDFSSGYDENAIHVNDKPEIEDFDERV